jgi:hypothetical protein
MTYSATVAIYGLKNTRYPGYTEGMLVPLMAWFKEHQSIHGWIDRKIVSIQKTGPMLIERKTVPTSW